MTNATYLITAGLPYASGSIHLGHLLEYVMTDIYARSRRLEGHEAIYVCADDTHGTPVEVAARKAGQSPEEFVARFQQEHVEDLESFGVAFDSYYTTNSEESRRWVNEIYGELKKKGHLVSRPMEQLYDEEVGRFLPDRFVKGRCPNCDSADQYGDVCEVCGKTYEPTDLRDPYSVLSKTRPVLRSSDQVFVRLSDFRDVIVEWLDAPGRVQPEVRRFIGTWLDDGLKDWCISRDAPYFGFPIPDLPEKYFYVWLDAPVGYISSTENWAKSIGQPERVDEIWRRGEAEIVHVIGKDITYFHTLFWPAMLHAAGLATPTRIQVHGMLTVDGVKMSKSRGTFILAAKYREHLDPTYLRWYIGSKVGPTPEDMDLSTDEFVNRVNAELVNNVANLVARSAAFVKNKLGGRYGSLSAEAPQMRALVETKLAAARAAYAGFDLSAAVRAGLDIADAGNKLFQDRAPWQLVKTDQNEAQRVVTTCANMARAAAVIVAPVVPELSAKIMDVLGLDGPPTHFDEARAFDLVERPVGEPVRLLDRMTGKALDALIEDSKVTDPTAAPHTGVPLASDAPPAELRPEITIDDFAQVDIRVGNVRKAEAVEGAKRLLRLEVDIGEPQPRTVFAGIAKAYADPSTLVDRQVVVVANLAPRKMKFGTSEGMVLAAGPGGADIQLLGVDAGAKPGSEVK